MRKTVSIVPSSAQKCIDKVPPPLLLSVPRDNGLVARKTGCPLPLNLIIISSASLSHSPRGVSMKVQYHFFSDPGPRNDTLMFFGLLTDSPDRLSRRTPGRTPFHPKQTLCGVPFQRAHPLPATPFQCPRSRTATLGYGAAAPFLPLRWPDCTLSRLRAEEYDRPVKSIATREPTVLSRVSCRSFQPEF